MHLSVLLKPYGKLLRSASQVDVMSDFQHAQLNWDDQGQPHSQLFDDVYFSRDNGLEETRHVFLESSQLEQRFRGLAEQELLCIGETGFGTGMNFLCTWQLFERCAPGNARLHFVSVEKYPLHLDDLRRAWQAWPELAAYSEALIEQYQVILPGFQRLSFAAGRVQLTLMIGDALDCLSQLDACIDAWYLDGFAPARNPAMWTPELFAQLARLSAPGASLATFTSSGLVRRGLSNAGFAVRRVPGFGTKWEMLQGHYRADQLPGGKPWYRRPAPPGERRALVIGGGLAGCSSAASLAARGWQVTLLERRENLASEASGNPQGILYLKPSAHRTTLSQLVLSGFGSTRRLLSNCPQTDHWQACGVLQLARDPQEQQRQRELTGAFPADLLHWVDARQASQLSGIPLSEGGLFYPQAGWVNPPALCAWWSKHPNIHLQLHQEVLELRRLNGQWQAWAGERLLAEAPVVILASALEITRFTQTRGLPLKGIRGQITRLPATDGSRGLKTVICAEGYVAPAWQGEHTLGASFNFQRLDCTPSAQEHASNLELLRDISGELAARLHADQLDPADLQGRAALRCTTPDYLPLVGPLADSESFAEAYAMLSKDARLVPETPCPWQEGLYLNSGHGSRGLITAPICAELLAAWLENEPLPLPRAVAEACHPNRFLLRRLIRRTDKTSTGLQGTSDVPSS